MTDPVFFKPARRFTVGEVAALSGARLLSPDLADRPISGLASADTGGEGALTFVESKKHAQSVAGIKVGAVFCPEELATKMPAGAAVLAIGHPHRAFVDIARLLFPSAVWPAAVTGETGVSPAAHVHADATLEEGVVVEAGAVVAAGAQIGRGTVVAPNAVIGADCRLGRDCHIGPGVSIQYALIGDRVLIGPGARIGHDGFGYMPGRAGPDRIPQIGRVVIQDDVEIGANTTIDRGAIDDTVIGDSSKIDNLVQIAHNVRIGRGCILAGNCGISGSVRLGDGVMLGGGVGIADHVNIGSGAAIAASSGVMNDVPAGERWGGTPAKPLKDAMREFVVLRKLVKASADKDKRNG